MLPVVGKWLLKLLEYDYEFEHRKGETEKIGKEAKSELPSE